MCAMVVKLSSTANTQPQVFHVEIFKEDSLGVEKADLDFGGYFD